MAWLHAIAGPLQGANFQLSTDEVNVGRQESNQLCVSDPSVSRHHCVIWLRQHEFLIRDLDSNNGTFVNGKRIEECVLTDGDKIRIGDTIFRFVARQETVEQLNLVDNGLIAVTAVERHASESAETAIQRLFETVDLGGESVARIKILLRIGAAVNTRQESETLQLELLKLILEAVPAEQAAVVLCAQNTRAEPTITGLNARMGEVTEIPLSRRLVNKAITDSIATFSDDVVVHHELSGLSSLSTRRVVSVLVVPLVSEGRAIGALYLDSADPVNRLNRHDLEFTAAIAEFVAPGLERATRLRALKEENRRLLTELHLKHDLIGSSAEMRQILERIAKIARTDATVLIRGETGTGKELVARAIHQNSARAARRFEAINCAILRDALLESELFGHERGSFTGAVAQKRGKLEVADGGSVFLDELAELGEAPQAMLLRVLQTREFQRLGGNRTMRADIRVIAATNENLEEAIKKKTFREDLYYRVNVVSITMPALRERREDIPLLADHFLQIYSRKNKRLVTKISPEAMSLLIQYDWPGNVRELENAIEYAVVFGTTDEVLVEDLPDTLFGSHFIGGTGSVTYQDAVAEAKRNIVRSAITQASGNYCEAARLLGMRVNNLHRLMRDLRLKPLINPSSSLAAKSGTN